MKKLRKIIILFLLVLFIAFFGKSLLKTAIGVGFRMATRKVLHCGVDYKYLEVKKNTLVFHDVFLKKQTNRSLCNDFSVEKIVVCWDVNFSTFSWDADVTLYKPDIKIAQEKMLKAAKLLKRKKSHFHVAVEKGQIELHTSTLYQKPIKASFSFSKDKYMNLGKVSLRFDQHSKIIIDINKQPYETLYSIDCCCVNAKYLYDAFSLYLQKPFSLLEDISGNIDGQIVLGMQQKQFSRLFLNIDISQFSTTTQEMLVYGENLHVEADIPVFCDKILSWEFFKKIPQDSDMNIRYLASIKELSISSHSSIIHNLCGNFSFHSSMGAKLNLNGKVENQEKVFALTVDGRSYFHNHNKKWLDLQVNFLGDEKDISKITIEGREQGDNGFLLHSDFHALTASHFETMQNLISPFVKGINDFSVTEGWAEGSINAQFSGSKLAHVECEHWCLKDVAIDNKKNGYSLFMSELVGDGSINVLEDIFNKSLSTEVKINGASIVYDNKEISDINVEISLNKGFFYPSTISGLFNFVEGSLELYGPINEINANFRMQGDSKNLLEPFNITTKNIWDVPFVTMISFQQKQKGGSFCGSAKIGDMGCENIVFGVDVDCNNLLGIDYKNFLEICSSGWMKAEKILLQRWLSLFPSSDIQSSGTVDIIGFLQKEKILAYICGQAVDIKSPFVNFDAKQVGSSDLGSKNNIVFSFDRSKHFWNMKLPLFDGNIFLPKFDLQACMHNAKLSISEKKAHLEVEEFQSEGMQLAGQVDFDFSDSNDVHYAIEAKSILGSTNSFCSFMSHFIPFNSEALPLKGNIEGHCFLHCTSNNNVPISNWNVSLQLHDGELALSDVAKIKDIQTHIVGDSSQKKIECVDTLGTYVILENDNLQKYSVSCPTMLWTLDKGLEFDCRLEKGTWNLLQCVGSMQIDSNALHFSFNRDLTSFYGMKVNISTLQLDKKGKLLDFALECTPSFHQLASQMQFLSQSNLFPISMKSAFLPMYEFDGMLNAKIFQDDDKALCFDLFADKVKYKNNEFSSLSISGKKTNQSIAVENFSINEFLGDLYLEKQTNSGEYKITSCHLSQNNVFSFSLDGCFSTNDGRISTNIKDLRIDVQKVRKTFSSLIPFDMDINGIVEGKGCVSVVFNEKELPVWESDLDLQIDSFFLKDIEIENKGWLHLHLSSKSGVTVRGVDALLSRGILKNSTLNYKCSHLSFFLPNKKWFFRSVQTNMPIEIIDGMISTGKLGALGKLLGFAGKYMSFQKSFNFFGDIECSHDFSFFEFYAKEGAFYVNGENRLLKDISLINEVGTCRLGFKYLHQNRYYTVDNIAKTGSEVINGYCSFLEENSNVQTPLTVDWTWDENKGLDIEKVCGKFCGMDANFHKVKNSEHHIDLFGKMTLDFSCLSKLVSKEVEGLCSHLQINKGYELRGHILLSKDEKKFSGIFSGKDFELGGYGLKTFLSEIDVSLDHMTLKKFKLSDSAGSILIDTISFEKNLDKQWIFSIPSINVVDMRPSLLKKLHEPQEEIKPLVIRNLHIFDLKGNMADKKSITGYGDCRFINSFKRGAKILEFPSDVFGRILGLDLELLIPVMGQMKYEIRDGRMYFTEMKDTFSENKRSEFFLAGKDLPYMDFDGNLHIFINMKQYVLFKITEKFILSITGNARKPKIELQKKRGFLAL